MIRKIKLTITSNLWGVGALPVDTEQASVFANMLEDRLTEQYPDAEVSVDLGKKPSIAINARGGFSLDVIEDTIETVYSEWSRNHQ